MRRIIDDKLLCFGAGAVEKMSNMLVRDFVAAKGPVEYDIYELAQKLVVDYLGFLLKLTVVAAAKVETDIKLVDSEYSGGELWGDVLNTEDIDHDFFRFADEVLFSTSVLSSMEKTINDLLCMLTNVQTSCPCIGLYVSTSNLYHDLTFGCVKFWLLECKDVDPIYTGPYESPMMIEVYSEIPPSQSEGVLYTFDGKCFPECVMEHAGMVPGQHVQLFVIKQEVLDLIS